MSFRAQSIVTSFLQADSHLVGKLYLLTSMLFAAVAAIAALLIQFDMLTPVSQVTGAAWYGRILTGHGMLMIFLVVLPLFPGLFGQLPLPATVGAPTPLRSRFGLIGWCCHLLGGSLVIGSLLAGAYDSGWVMMMPIAGYSVPFITLIGGLMLAALATLLPSIEVVRMTLSRKIRAVPMSQLPLFGWFLMLGSLAQVFVTPIRHLTLMGLLGGHLWGWNYFALTDPDGIARYQIAFWLYAGPATVSLVLYAIGIGFEVLIARTGSNVSSRTALVVSGIGLLVLAIASWPQHLTASAEGELYTIIGSFFGLLMTLCAAYILYQMFRLLVRIARPYTGVDLFLISSLVCGLLSGAAGAALAFPALAMHLHNTYFTVAHLHLALAGVIGGAALGGLFHFWPRWWHCRLSDRSARLTAGCMLFGICLSFLPMIALGAYGLPRSLYVYPNGYRLLHAISSFGSLFLVASMLHAAFALWLSIRRTTDPQNVTDRGGEFSYTNLNPTPDER